MRVKNLTPNEIKDQIDQKLDKNSRYNGTMTKVKVVAEPTLKDLLIQFMAGQTKFNEEVKEFMIEQGKFNNEQKVFNKRIESKVDGNTKMIKQAHPELFNNKK